MKTKEFLKLLQENASKELLFEYRDGKVIPKAYHITEVKSIHVDSVDCGGKSHAYDETVVQLWISPKEQKNHYLRVDKARKIFDIVDRKKALLQNTPIFFEYGDQETPTSVYAVDQVEHSDTYLKVKLSVPPTACKPREILNTVSKTVNEAVGCCGSGQTACC